MGCHATTTKTERASECDNLAVKREEGFIRCSRIQLDHGEYRKKFKPVDYDKCTERVRWFQSIRKRLQLWVAFQQTTYVILYTWYTKPLLVSIVRDHDSNDKSSKGLFIWGELVRLAGLARITSYIWFLCYVCIHPDRRSWFDTNNVRYGFAVHKRLQK